MKSFKKYKYQDKINKKIQKDTKNAYKKISIYCGTLQSTKTRLSIKGWILGVSYLVKRQQRLHLLLDQLSPSH